MELPNFKTIKRLSLALQENCKIIEQHLQNTDDKVFGSIHKRLTYSFLGETLTEDYFEKKFHHEADRIYQETTAQINLLCEMLGIEKPMGLETSKHWIKRVENVALAGLAIGNCEEDE